MAQNTPAPWVLNGAFNIAGPSGRPIVMFCGMFDDEQHANGRLITAAPELLSALISCSDHLKAIGYFGGELEHQTRAAIIKATQTTK